MFITKKKHNRILTGMVAREMQLLAEKKFLESEIARIERMDTDQLIDHMINKYECGNTVKFKSKSEPSETVIEVNDNF